MNTATNFPQLVSRIADKDGRITPVWYNFFLNFFNRTGGSQGDVINSVTASDSSLNITTTNGAVEAKIANTGVTAATYTNMTATVNAKGQIISATSHPGFTGTGAYTNFTIVNGIITNAF